MRTLRTLLIALTGLFVFSSCGDEEAQIAEELTFESVNIPSAYYADNSTAKANSDEIDEVTFEVSVTSPEGVESTGYGRMVFTGDQSISSFELTSNIFEETGMDANFWVDAVGDSPNGRIFERVCECKGKQKGRERRRCRLKCVGYAVIAAAVVVGAIVTNL